MTGRLRRDVHVLHGDCNEVLCPIHLSSRARHGEQPLDEWIVETARREDLQGATA